MTNPRSTRSAAQRATMRTTTGIAVPTQQPARDPNQTYDPRTFPQPPGPTYDYEFRIWRFPRLDESKWGTPRDRFRNGNGTDGAA